MPWAQAQYWGEGTITFPESTQMKPQSSRKTPPSVPSSANSLKLGVGVPRGLGGVRGFTV